MLFNRILRKTGLPAVLTLLFLLLTSNTLVPLSTAYAASTITINGAKHYQTMDGFGFSDAFGPADTLRTLTSASEQKQVLDLLLSQSTGAGFTILRNLMPSDPAHTIEPNSPGKPTATPSYVWDHSSWGQVWLAQQAQKYGAKQIYLDAWSAPGFMKTNGSEINGGTLCGAPGATCSSGDWRQAYANYLLQYLRDYKSEGVSVSHIGYVNEPNLVTSYSSMIMNPTQAADFATVLGPTLASSSFHPQIICCEPEGWNLAQSYANGVTSNAKANKYVNVISSHGYTAPPNSALTGTGTKHIWETEWSLFDTWDPTWDSGGDASGFNWAQRVYTGVTAANLSAFFYWWGVGFNSSDNGALIHDNNGTVIASKRLWALASYSRFIHPGATRIAATTGDSNLQVTSYKNTDGSTSIVVLNNSKSATPISISLQNLTIPAGAHATPYLTDASHNVAAQARITISTNKTLTATVGARALVTYHIA